MINRWGVYPVQILDGIGAGLQSVAVPGLVARILNGTGRVNVGQGAVMTVQGLGASLSPAIGGWIAQEIGYSAMFLILGSFALGSIALWLGFASLLKPACAAAEDERAAARSLSGREAMIETAAADCMMFPDIDVFDAWPDLGHRRARHRRRDPAPVAMCPNRSGR